MATISKRALTLATVGLLSGVPVTIATDGIIQIAEAVVTPSIPDSTVLAGGRYPRGPLIQEINVNLRGDFYETIRWFLSDRSQFDYRTFEPRTSEYVAREALYLLVRDTAVFQSVQPLAEESEFRIFDRSDVEYSRIPVAYAPIAWRFVLGDTFDFTTPHAYAIWDRALVGIEEYTTTAFDKAPVPAAPQPQIQRPVAEYADITEYAVTVEIADATVFNRVRSYSISIEEQVQLRVRDALSFSGVCSYYGFCAPPPPFMFYDYSYPEFIRMPYRYIDDTDRILLLFAHMMTDEDDV